MNSEGDLNMVNQMNEPSASIVVSAVGKRYRIYNSMSDRFKQTFVGKGKKLYRDFWALKNINFTLTKGETIGIIGKNGSGKSTLLQLICGIIKPTTGSVATNGRIAALLELGTGFNPEFTGHENIFVNGSLLGLKKQEINRLYDSILSFADIGNFINQPVKTYSSGMMVRLAFAIATCAIPDILIVDEALAVGDEFFQKKCYSRIRELQENGCTILFVSHALQNINNFCSKAILIDAGELLACGEPKKITSIYQQLIYSSGETRRELKQKLRSHIIEKEHGNGRESSIISRKDDQIMKEKFSQTDQSGESVTMIDQLDKSITASTVVIDTTAASINYPIILNGESKSVNILQKNHSYSLTYEAQFHQNVDNVSFAAMIKTIKGVNIGGIKTLSGTGEDDTSNFQQGQRVDIAMSFVCRLNPGLYSVNLTIFGNCENNEPYAARMLDALAFRVMDNGQYHAMGIVDFFDDAFISKRGITIA